MRIMLKGLLATAALATTAPAFALNFDWGEFGFNLTNRISAGAFWRVEERDPALVGKLNVNPDLCPDDCLSLSGDPEPNQRLVDAPGAFFGITQDDGNLNYDKGDIVSGLARLTTDFTANWRDFTLKARGIGFFDVINEDFDDFHPNTNFQPEETPRTDRTIDLVGRDIELLDLLVAGTFFLGDRALSIAVGQQKIRWGEANLIALNSLNEITPPDARRLRQPGTQINEVFQPVPLVSVSMDLTQTLLAEAFYQWKWRRVIPDPAGSFMADVDVLERDDPHAIVALGQFPEDPNGDKRLNNPAAGFLTDTSFTATIRPFSEGYPRDGGQYGVRLNWFAENINNGTEFGFYGMNYHSRLPYLSVYAADRSCLRDAQSPVLAELVIACEGFSPNGGREPLPIDTLDVLAEYPEDIRMFGISFNTNLGSWSIAGEYSYRPNLPVQVSVADVVFAGLQPAFPEEDIVIGAEGVTAGATGGNVDAILGPIIGAITDPVTGEGFPLTVPGARNGAPDFIETLYRGNTVTEGQYIPGFERLKVGQFAVTGIRILGSSNPIASLIAAEQIILLVETGLTHVIDLPKLSEVQFDGGSPNRTHYSPGADGTGSETGEPDSRTFNPTQQTTAFVDKIAWGYRVLGRFEYNDVVLGMNFKPFFIWSHDVDGYAPTPMQNFLEDRMEWIVGTEIEVGQRWTGQVEYRGFAGNRHNSRRDRDHAGFSIAYTF